jgi:hypothetical protein
MRVVIGETYDGQVIASLLVAQRYELAPGGGLRLECDDAELPDEPVYHERAPGPPAPSLLRCDSFALPFRLATDVVVQGTARSERAVAELRVRLCCVGRDFALDHTIVATGDRVVEARPGGSVGLSAPRPFTEMPVRYDRAFGGTDARAELALVSPEARALAAAVCDDPQELAESGALSYPRNPAGRGHFLLVESALGGAWPNLEWADERLDVRGFDDLLWPFERWVDRPSPAAFDWVPHGWFPRCAAFGLSPLDDGAPAPAIERALGVLTPEMLAGPRLGRLHPYCYQGAHPRFWQRRLHGDERLYVSAMSPDGRGYDVRLPGLRPEVRLRAGAGGFRAAGSALDVVFLEADAARLTLLWRASCLVDDDELAPDLAERVEHRLTWGRE